MLPKLAGALLFAFALSAGGQDSYPNRPIRLVVPYPPGGGTDILGRLLAAKMSENMGQPIVIDNRAGASGQVGTDYVAKAAPDGYTIVMGATPLTINPSLYQNIPYDILRDFAPVSLLVSYPFVMVVHPSVPANNVREFIALARAQPGKLNYASHSSGSATHLAGELMKTMASIDMVHVPYKGAAPAVADLVAGRVAVLFDNPSTSMPHVQAGRLRALAVTSAKRTPMLPNVPSVAEAMPGMEGYEVLAWFGLLAPARTPKPIVDRLSAEIARAARSPDLAEKLRAQSYDIVAGTADEFAAFIRSEVPKWVKVVKESGAKVD